MTAQHTARLNSRSDGSLIVCIRDGDLEALGELYERYKNTVYRTALAITRDERAAEDILQDAFLRVYTYADRIDETVTLGPWLYRVTVNMSYTWTNRVKRWLYSVHDTLDRWVLSSQWYPEATVEEQEWREMIQQAIDTLSPTHRVVVVLHYLEELSLKEIAYVMDVPEGTVKSRLHYARGKLKKAILEQEHRLVPEVAYDFT
jgi:RNA polymerase sigma-70 factor (ECF subfamily)